MPAHYQKNQLSFQYPDNWKLTDSANARLPYELSLETPGGGFWTLSVYSPQSNVASLSQDLVESLQEQYDSVEIDELSEQIGVVELNGFDVRFFCLDLLVEARIRHFHDKNYAYLLLAQAESREFDQIQAVFSAVTTSLLMDSAPVDN